MSSFKTLSEEDKVTLENNVHEEIPITGTIVSGTYDPPDQGGDTSNIKNATTGMYQKVYDYPHFSSSANPLFDISYGQSPDSGLSDNLEAAAEEKENIYNEYAQLLVGYNEDGSIREFDEDGNFAAGGTKLQECFFLNYSRVLKKDEIKRGSFSLTPLTGGASSNPTDTKTLEADADKLYSNSPAGEYTQLTGAVDGNTYGLLYYQAGVAVVTASVFDDATDFGSPSTNWPTVVDAVCTGTIPEVADGIRNRWYDNNFENTTELMSSVYFCKINSGDFNYSSNPTYLSSSQLRVKEKPSDQPFTYITTVGLYSPDNELLAVGKLSEPIKKSPSQELNLRVRLDY